MVDAITITIIVFLILNIIGVLFFNGKYDSKLTTLSNTSTNYNSPYSNNYDSSYKMGTVNTSSIYNSIAPTMQQVKSNIVSKLDNQKSRIQEQEKKLEAHRQSLLAKQQELQTEIDKLNDQLSSSLTTEQLNQINQIKNSLKVKINNIQTQLHGVNANKAQCVVPYSPSANSAYTDNFSPLYQDERILRRESRRQSRDYSGVRRNERGVRRDERGVRRDERQLGRDERQLGRDARRKLRAENPYFQDDWSSDNDVDDVYMEDAVAETEQLDVEDNLKYNECFSNINPYVNVFSSGSATSFAPY